MWPVNSWPFEVSMQTGARGIPELAIESLNKFEQKGWKGIIKKLFG